MSLRLEWEHDLDRFRDDWTRLAERSGNVFATWEWNSIWWRHFGSGRPSVARCVDERGAAAAIVPIYVRRRGPLRVGRFIGHGPADEQGPVSADGDARGGEALALACADAPDGLDVLLAERLPATRAWGGPVGARVLQRESSPVASIAGLEWESYLGTRSPNLRSQVRRKERKLQREHGLTYRLSDRATLARDLETAFDLHAARWGGGSSGALSGARADFHREFATVALERGWLRLWTAEADGRPVASWYGLRFGGTESFYQSGRDPAWNRMSVGLVLLAHTIREAIDDGMREYRFLRGGESYKQRFATSDPGLETIALGRRGAGRAVVSAAALALRMPGPLRRRAVRAVG